MTIIAYKENIAEKLRELYKNAPSGSSTHYLEEYNQQDVADTANYFASINPKIIQDTFVDYSNKAPVVFMK